MECFEMLINLEERRLSFISGTRSLYFGGYRLFTAYLSKLVKGFAGFH
jgi:hypothetical protein